MVEAGQSRDGQPVQPSEQDEQQFDGPWNMPALREARARQVTVRIGDLPMAAAPLGEPYLRGAKKVQSVLLSPLAGSAAPPGPDPRLPVQHSDAAPLNAVVMAQESPSDQAAGLESRSLFAQLSEFDSQPESASSQVEEIPSSRRRWPLLATAAAFALSIGIPVAVHLSSPSSPAVTPATASPAVAVPADNTAARLRAQLLSWARSYLPPDAVIVTDQVSGDQLKAAGFTNVHTFGHLAGTSLPTVDYVLDVPSSQAQQAGQSGRTQLLATSLPLAQFGLGSTADTARALFGSATASARRHQQADSLLRRQGGLELGQNPAIVADTASRAVLVAGQLDLRAQNVLNLLASTGPIYLTSPQLISAEQQVGQPVRSIVITSDNLSEVQNVLASMSAPYKPDTIVSVSQRKLRLGWTPAIAPVATVGQ